LAFSYFVKAQFHWTLMMETPDTGVSPEKANKIETLGNQASGEASSSLRWQAS